MATPVTARRVRVSLQAKLLTLVLFCVVVPLLSLGGYLLNRNQETLRDKVHEAITNQLFRKSTQLQDWANQRLRDASSWSSSIVVFEGTETLARGGPDGERARRDIVDYLLSVLGHYRVYESLFVVDLTGHQVLAGTTEEQLDDWAFGLLNPGKEEEGKDDGRPLSALIPGNQDHGPLSRINRSALLQRATQLVVQPIHGRGKTTVGYFVGRIDLRDFEGLLNTPVDAETAFLLPKLDAKEIESRLGTSSDLTPAFWVLDEDGKILVEAGKLSLRPGEKPFPAQIPSDAPQVIPVKEARLAGLGDTVYGVRRLDPPLRGYLAATVASSAAYKSVSESRNRLLLYGGSAMLGIFLVTFAAARAILKPILALVDGAKKISEGEFVDLKVSGADEIAELTQAFNEMGHAVRDGRKKLEEARDELARSNEGLKEANRALEALAITDGLTGLYNHRHFQETLEKEMRRCEREGRKMSLLLLDLDHFKQYNDRWGHTEGDAALRRVAGQVMKSIRSTDMAFRYGGEELAVLLPSCTKDQAVDVAEKIRVAVSSNPQRPGRFGARTTISIGVATFPEDGRVSRGLVDASDAALYSAKAQGRDRVVQAGSHGPMPVPRSETAG